jgi:hypothetical protein
MNEHQPQTLSAKLPGASQLRFLRRPNLLNEGEEQRFDPDLELPEDLQAMPIASSGQGPETHEHQPQELDADLASDNPSQFLRGASQTSGESLRDEQVPGFVAELKGTLETARAKRTAVYRDAITVVAREMERRGQNLACWTEKDAQAACEIADILIGLGSQHLSAPDPAFA